MNDKISVIMSTYNEKESWLRQSIESILNQSYKNLEFIIVLDNPQNKDIYNIVQTYSQRDSRIIVIKNEFNIGLTASLNKALLAATGNYIARMDADDISIRNRLKLQLNYLKTNHLDIVGSYIQIINEDNMIIQKETRYPTSSCKVDEQLTILNCVPHPTWLVRKEVYDNLKGYRDIPTCEDYDFLLRAKHLGYKISNISKVLLAYRMTSKSISRSNLLKQYLTSRYLQKNLNNIEFITNNDIESYLKNKITLKASSNYEIGFHLCMKAIELLDQKRIIECFYYLIKSMLQSKWIVNRICIILFGSIKIKINALLTD